MLRVVLTSLVLFTILLSQTSWAKTDPMDPELKKIVDSIVTGSPSQVLTESCQIQKEKWAAILLTRENFVENIKFNSQCDLEGKFTVMVDQFFPVNLKIRKLKNHQNIFGHFKFEILFTTEAVLKLSVKEATLKGKDNIYFNLHYSASIDPLNPKDMLKKRLGGELILMSKDFKKILKKYPLN